MLRAMEVMDTLIINNKTLFSTKILLREAKANHKTSKNGYPLMSLSQNKETLVVEPLSLTSTMITVTQTSTPTRIRIRNLTSLESLIT